MRLRLGGHGQHDAVLVEPTATGCVDVNLVGAGSYAWRRRQRQRGAAGTSGNGCGSEGGGDAGGHTAGC